MKLRRMISLSLLLAVLTTPAYGKGRAAPTAQKGSCSRNAKVYDKDFNLQYNIRGNKVYDKDFNLQYNIRGNKVYDKDFNLKYNIRNDSPFYWGK